jgi:hypothetical protein
LSVEHDLVIVKAHVRLYGSSAVVLRKNLCRGRLKPVLVIKTAENGSGKRRDVRAEDRSSDSFTSVTSRLTTTFGGLPSHPRARRARDPEIRGDGFFAPITTCSTV